MSQHDFTIANQTASSARSDINSGLQALASNNSGASAPSTTYANMWWYETDTNLLKIRNEGNSAWINVAYVNQSTNKFEILDSTKLVTTSGAQAGLLGDQTTATWQAGTGTTESLVSPAKIKAAIDSNVEGITHTSGSAPYYGVRAYGKVRNDAKVDGGNFASWTASTNTVTFTTPMPHANYAVIIHGQSAGNTYAENETVNGFQIVVYSSGGNLYNPTKFDFAIVC